MSQVKNDLSVRQYQRQRCDLPSRVRLDEADAACVKLSPLASVLPGTLDVRVTDTSRGGLGLSSAVYLPPGTRLTATVEVDGTPRAFLVRVQRVRMTDRKPTYYIGTSFGVSSAEHAAIVDALLAQCAKAEAANRA